MALIVVLGLLAMAVSLSLAMTYGQGTMLKVQSNANRQASARQAAITGLTAAIGKMHRTSWAGVGTTFSGTISSTETYSATYTAGDSTLASTSSENPYRVTIVSTGYATDPTNPTSPASYRAQAVLKLVPRALSSEPSFMTTATQYTVYQADGDDFRLEMPARLQGAVRLNGPLRFAESYPDSSSSSRYLSDMKLLSDAGYDYRPFTGTVTLPFTVTGSSMRDKLAQQLQVTVADVTQTTSNLTLSTWQTTYKLYAGGPTYNMQTVSSSLSSTTLAPDPATNPLGIFYCANKITVGNDVTITGTLFSPVEVEITGANVTFNSTSAQALNGTTDAIRLPVIASNLVTVASAAGCTINGLVQAGDRFKVSSGSTSTRCNLTGRLITEEFRIETRTTWNNWAWSFWWALFQWQLNQSNPQTNYVTYLWGLGLSPVPQITIVPDATSRRDYYFQANSNPLYTTVSGDVGLYWDLVDWDELGP